ncbi:MAG: hypothetical protein LUE13_02470 [Akkermansiaceae bacterium]|nr:hypothetical protein [Akkermansiaceae bacterium]
MTIYPFTVSEDNNSEPLRNVLLDLMEEEVSKRNKSCMGTDFMRIQEIEQRTIGTDNREVFLMDFIRIRMTHGPAKGGLDTPIVGFELENNEGFCEESGALYVPSFNLFVVQYNHAGIKSNRMIEYISDFYHDRCTGFRIDPVIRSDIRERLRSKDIITKFELKIRPNMITDEDRKNNISVAFAAQSGEMAEAAYVSIILGSERRGELNSNALKRSAQWVLEKITDQPEAIEKACISGKENELDLAETLDLLNYRIHSRAEIQPGIDKRFPREDRWDALVRSFQEWKREGLIHEETQL